MPNFAFIQAFLTGDIARLKSLSFILLIFYVCVLIAIFLDLFAGVDRARREGKLRTSDGFKRTLYKVRDYYTIIVLFTILDVIASIWFSLPFFTAIGTMAIVLVEGKSIYENKKNINKGIRDLPEAISQIQAFLKDKDNAKALLSYLEVKAK